MITPKRIYLAFLALVTLWCAGILLAPLLKSAGLSLSSFLYSFYSSVCHQVDGRSIHVAGHKLGVCARCASLYLGFLVALLIYPFLRSLRAQQVPGRHWFLVGVAPMIIDVLLNFTGLHASTIATRTASGFIFGSFLPFYLLPPLLEAVAQVIGRLSSRGDLTYARKAEQV
ncbi:MAG: DUF2085 domain-containing protein [Ignavibacteria bacterium]|nr:DUF2085 domain-containing protein [Ignavibacteria bacterium]